MNLYLAGPRLDGMNPLVFLSFFVAFALAAPIFPRKSLTPSSSTADFSAKSSVDVSGILAAVNASHEKPVASYASRQGKDKNVKIYGDWSETAANAYFFTADMDVDCDGVDVSTKHYLYLYLKYVERS